MNIFRDPNNRLFGCRSDTADRPVNNNFISSPFARSANQNGGCSENNTENQTADVLTQSDNSSTNINFIESRRDSRIKIPLQTHTHEFESSTKLAEEGQDRHNHRFTGVTSEVIPLANNMHKHAIFTLTDYFGHLHEVAVETEPNIDVGHGKHVHFISGNTTRNDDHFHQFDFTTLIEAPLLPE